MYKKKECEKSIALGAKILKKGGLVSVMAETVYGLAADSSNLKAVRKIYSLKKRPTCNPLIIHVNSIRMAEEIAFFTKEAQTLASYFWPGPLTMILKKRKSKKLCALATSNLKTVAVRMPDSKVFLDLIQKLGNPLAAPSANLSGYISSTKGIHVEDCFGKNIDLIIDSGKSRIGIESTIINLTTKPYRLERLGVIDKAKITEKTKIRISERRKKKGIVAPGQFKKHYSPNTPIRLNAKRSKNNEAFLSFGKTKKKRNEFFLNLSPNGNLNEAASNLFDFLRQLDKLKKSKIAISPIPEQGIGKTINERLKRASFNEK